MSEQSTMSDNQRRFVCRIVFLLLCALPTAIGVYAAFHRPSPIQWQNLIRAQLGIPVRIASVETPVPFTTILRDVRIPDLCGGLETESNADLLIDEVRIDLGDTQNVVTVVQPLKLQMPSLSHVLHRLSDHLGQMDFDHKHWRFEFKKIVLTEQNSASPDFVVRPVVVHVARGNISNGPRVQGQMLAWTQMTKQNELNRSTALKLDFGNKVVLETGSQGVPVRLLRYWYPELDLLGSHCKFLGTLNVEEVQEPQLNDEKLAATCQGNFKGRLEGVELDRLAGPYSLGLVGRCNVENVHFEFHDDQVDFASMRIHSADPILVSGELLIKARKLGVDAKVNREEAYKFPNLNLKVVVDQGALFLNGDEGTVISKNTRGDVFMSVYPLDITVHDLATILTGSPTNEDAIAFLSRFRMPQRIARQPIGSSSNY